MALIPIPSRGTPLDVDLLITIISEFNNIKTFFDKLSGKAAQFRGRQITMSDISIQAFTRNVVATTQSTVATTKSVDIQFSPAFKEAPIISATIVNVPNTTGTTDNATLTVSNLTTSGATVNVRFAGATSYTLDVHVIAIGLPV